jgi:hypothetical protein
MAVPKKRKYKSWKKHKLNIKFTILNVFKNNSLKKKFNYDSNLIKLFIR